VSRRYFGTDGVRGVANEKLTPELAFELGLAAGRWLAETDGVRRVVLGRDTRKSGSMLGAALASGLCATGVDVVTLGVAPTPTVAFAARTGDYGLGAILSASHNPAPDNGIKLVGHDGRKLPDEVEAQIESLMSPPEPRPTGGDVGAIVADRSDIDRYLDFLVDLAPGGLAGKKIAVDAAHGAAFEIAETLLARLGAQVVAVGTAPNGVNINAEGGATKPEVIRRLTESEGAWLGVAFDGDADRAVFSDGQGRLINGDRVMAFWAKHRGETQIVGTVMTNTGCERFLVTNGIRLLRTPVGDKYVAAQMRESGAVIGGEQSGHLIFSDYQPTGDGLLTLLQFALALAQSDLPASAAVDMYDAIPQLLVNVTVSSTKGWSDIPAVKEALSAAEQRIAGHGRWIVRASGTQPMIRLMLEADTFDRRDSAMDDLLDVIRRELQGQVEGRVDLTHDLGD
jgi:phosphoglucosamine mutase